MTPPAPPLPTHIAPLEPISPDQMDRIINQWTDWSEKLVFWRAVVVFCENMRDYKTNVEWAIATGHPIPAPPLKPIGFEIPIVPTAPVKPIPVNSVVQQKAQNVYPAPGDTNPAGTVIDNPWLPGDEKIKKVIQPNPFSTDPKNGSHYWVDVV